MVKVKDLKAFIRKKRIHFKVFNKSIKIDKKDTTQHKNGWLKNKKFVIKRELNFKINKKN